MKKLITLLFAVSLFAPLVTFAQTDDQIRASLVQQLLAIFVVQVNGIDKMQTIAAQSSNPAQFSSFNTLLSQQLSETTSQLASLLNGDVAVIPSTSTPTPVFGGIGTSPVPTPNPQLATLKQQIYTLQQQLTTLQQAAEDERADFNAPGRGCTFQGTNSVDCGQLKYSTFISDNTHQQQNIQIQLQSLQNQIDSMQ